MNLYIINLLIDKTIEYSFYALFFFIPLILTPWNYELFEYNKMMLTYALTALVLAAWLGKMVVRRKLILRRTPLDIPIALFFLSQVASFLFSIDPYVSFWGYYSRFHGGLLSTITYIILYYAFVSNFSDKFKTAAKYATYNFLLISLLSGLLVSIYGILEHFGIDKNLWIQDVQNRVFSTLGQPNWLAAYLVILILISVGIWLSNYLSGERSYGAPRTDVRGTSQYPGGANILYQKIKLFTVLHPWFSWYWDKSGNQKSKVKSQKYNSKSKIITLYLLPIIFYITLLYTKSRSGFLGLWVANLIFWVFVFTKWKKNIIKPFLIFNFALLIFNFVIGTPFVQYNQYFTIKGIYKTFTHQIQSTEPTPPQGPALETGGTESGEIRRIVWKGAIDITKHYPLFGSGVETFAFAYYQFRPAEHNLTSEWDFLYNKAHNEYLNYAATTGLFGLGSYLLLIGSFVWWSIKKLKVKSQKFKVTVKSSKLSKKRKLLALNSNFSLYTLLFALFAGYSSILITNFFGFSVVTVALFFWLIPAMSFVLSNETVPLYGKDHADERIIPDGSNDSRNQGRSPVKQSSAKQKHLSTWKIALLIFIILSTLSILTKLALLWYADTLYARGYQLAQADQYTKSYQFLHDAIKINPTEPIYHDEAAANLAILTLAAFSQNEATLASTLENQAIAESNYAITTSPNNVNFWKTRTRVFYTLGSTNEKYFQKALEAISQAHKLSPTDAKITYNMALIQTEIGKKDEAIETLKQAVKLKTNYREPHFALALFYEEKGNYQKTRKELEYILNNINPDDKKVKEKLEEISNL